MLKTGQLVSLDIEKPAAGGRMIARAAGQVVLVAGAIPGERVSARIERVGKGVAYAQVEAVETASVDRRQSSGDPHCGGCAYALMAYPRQLQIKGQVIADALGRIGRIPWAPAIEVVPSPEQGYRMRARLHYRRRRLGLFREGTHEICDVRATGQLLAESCDALDRLQAGLQRAGKGDDCEIELSENVPATERALHLETTRSIDASSVASLATEAAFTGFSIAEPGSSGTARAAVLSGDPRVHDVLTVAGETIAVSRHVLAFFQGNRFLLEPLIAHVLEQVEPRSRVIDLYAGAGLFALSAAVVKGASVVAVEGDLVSASDLSLNAAPLRGAVEPMHLSVEEFTSRHTAPPGTVIVDPPRTGMTKDALHGVVALGAPRLTYVSCDVATLGRDARGLLDAGYRLASVRGFDLFPNTPHVETVAVFER